MKKLLLATCALSLIAAPGAADAKKRKAPAPPPAPIVRVAPTDPVEAFYFHHGDTPIWFRSDATRVAATRLSAILRRAPVDGFAAGPVLAAQVDAAIASAAPGNAAATKAAELTLSKAWVAFMQHLRTPPKGMIYGYDLLRPHHRADTILLTTAAGTANLSATLDRLADVNSTYRALREAALASGMTSADANLLSNLERARVLPASGRFIIVDGGNAMLTMYENGQPVDRMKVVVGTKETPTPMIASVIHWMTLNPFWNVPPNLVRKTIAPGAIKGGDAYLRRGGYEAMNGWGPDATVLPASQVDWKAVLANPESIRIRQKPGATNSMGRLKVPFPSGQDIFLHDTPNRAPFADSARQLSNGCVRLEDAKRLARWLMGSEPKMSGTDPEQFVQIPTGVPIYLTYLTAEPGPDGKLAARKDPYGWDGRPDLQLAAATMYTSVARPAP